MTITTITKPHNFRQVLSSSNPILPQPPIFRSASIDSLSDADLNALRGVYNIQAIFDLRSADEQKHTVPNANPCSPSIPIIHLPAVEGFPLGFLETYFKQLLVDHPAASAKLYMYLCQNSVAAFSTILQYLRDSPGSGILVHCELGKDRTGVFVAILLLLLGVPDKEIIRDYCLSDEGIASLKDSRAQKFSKLEFMKGVAIPPMALDRHFGAVSDGIRVFLAEFRGVYGIAGEGYLELMGLGSQDIGRIRENLQMRWI